SAFLEDMVAYPGGVIQDVIQHLWADNRLAEGRLPLNNHEVVLSEVATPMMLVTGHKDVIVTHECSQRMLEHVNSDDVTTLQVPGGHMGILGGSVGPKHIWPQVADWLLERS
ncbi:MAG: alpha/beta hydrolase, partial [Salinisphaeraceae bacterium]|nr:alpha/beta hydrolase [Salinisphaeraceae bacterium]